MMASRLSYRGHIIPALTDHLEDNGGVTGRTSSTASGRAVNTLMHVLSA
jgi:hypothetical protein